MKIFILASGCFSIASYKYNCQNSPKQDQEKIDFKLPTGPNRWSPAVDALVVMAGWEREMQQRFGSYFHNLKSNTGAFVCF